MNLYLHGVDAGPSPVRGGIDALAEPPDRLFSVVLTNPPFGKKGSIPTGQNGKGTGDGGDEPGGYSRPDLWVATANKQLNFLQHVFTLLEQGGRCAIVVPDNVLFEGGAGEVIRRNLLERCRVHTLLRLPPGIFYAQGVKANVLFFDREEPEHRATMWVYDLRSSKHFTLRQRPIQRSDFDEFVECYRPNELEKRRQTWSEKRPEGRWRRFDCGNLLTSSKVSLELSWLRDEEIHAANRDLPPSGDLAAMIANELRTAWEQFDRVSARLNRRA